MKVLNIRFVTADPLSYNEYSLFDGWYYEYSSVKRDHNLKYLHNNFRWLKSKRRISIRMADGEEFETHKEVYNYLLKGTKT